MFRTGPVPTVDSDSCSWLIGVEPNVVSCFEPQVWNVVYSFLLTTDVKSDWLSYM